MNRQTQIDAFLLAAHRLALQRLREDPARLDVAADTLARWRARAGASRSDAYWDEWQSLIEAGMPGLEAVCADNDHAAALRNVSPLGGLLTQRERGELLRAARMEPAA